MTFFKDQRVVRTLVDLSKRIAFFEIVVLLKNFCSSFKQNNFFLEINLLLKSLFFPSGESRQRVEKRLRSREQQGQKLSTAHRTRVVWHTRVIRLGPTIVRKIGSLCRKHAFCDIIADFDSLFQSRHLYSTFDNKPIHFV